MFLTEMIKFSFFFLFPFFLFLSVFPHQRESLYCSLARFPSSALGELPCARKLWPRGPVGLYAGTGTRFFLLPGLIQGWRFTKGFNRKEKLPTLLFSFTTASRFKLKLPLPFSLCSSKNTRFPLGFRREGNFGWFCRCRWSPVPPGPQGLSQ